MTPFAVLLAGGTGTRLFPLSTPDRPKQVLPLLPDGRTPLRATWDRLGFPGDRVLVVTGRSMEAAVRACLPELPNHAFVVEPEPRNTLPALIAAAAEVVRRGGDRLISVHADHRIDDEPAFRAAAHHALQATESDELVLVGLPATRPDPGLGWIVPGEALPDGTRRVVRFVEKPPVAVAEALLTAGALWNLGLFAWRLPVFEQALGPEHAAGYRRLAAGEDLAAVWSELPRISVDHGVVERVARARVVEGRFDWSDLGTFAALGLPEPGSAANDGSG